jgi:hypothetical protein
LSRFPQQLGNASLEPSGVYEDGWVAEKAAVTLAQPQGRQVLAVRGSIPRIDGRDFRANLTVSIDGRAMAREPVSTGDFSLAIPAEAEAGKRRIGLAFDASQQLPGGDGRTVGARLSFLGFEQPARPRAGDEIVQAGSGVRLGSGWDVLETFRNETFRWVANDAQFFVRAAAAGDRRLRMTVAPGPGVGGSPFVLRVVDASGRQVDAVEVRRREIVDLFVPVGGGGEHEFRLRVDGGGKRGESDARVLNFRVFRIELRG